MGYTTREKLILRELSSNSRATITYLSKVAGCSRITVIKTIDKLITRLSLKFTLEVNTEKLGLSERYLLAIRLNEKPDEETLKAFFTKDDYAQCVYRTNGTFDILIYAVADSPVNYIKWETRIAESLSKYGPTIMPSRYVFSHFGFMPLNDSFVELINPDQKLDDTDKGMLRLLNRDSRASYSYLGQKLGISEATARYRMFRLIKKGLITRFTVAAQLPGEGYSSIVYFINYTFTKTTSSVSFANARNSYFKDDDMYPMFNNFQLIFPVTGSFRSFGMVLCDTKRAAYDKAVRRHKRIYPNENIRISYGEVTECIKGLFPFRSLDIRKDYKTVSWSETKL